MRRIISILIGIVVMVVVFLSLGLLVSSLAVRCDLQNDQVYTCQARDTLFGVTIREVSAEQVYDISRELTCKGAGPNKGCSAHAEFNTATGETIILSTLYTNPDQVQKAVNALKPLMADKSTPIDIVFPPSTFTSVVIFSVVSCLFILFVLIALIFLFGKDPKDLKARTIDLRRKN
ncbi:MAG: hypothetical protein CNIPEHKO_00235 [Anaerolineales bacterium]|nr:hypothetical protein [Anaerolineales bacterium]